MSKKKVDASANSAIMRSVGRQKIIMLKTENMKKMNSRRNAEHDTSITPAETTFCALALMTRHPPGTGLLNAYSSRSPLTLTREYRVAQR